MHLIPRTTLAQKMDALSSQTNIAGYKAVLIASCHIEKYMPLLMTAAGTIPPAKVVVIGAGVAGVQAIPTAKRLGAQVEARHFMFLAWLALRRGFLFNFYLLFIVKKLKII